jgi:hypothetical protein
VICSTEETKLAVQQELKTMRATVETTYKSFADMDDVDAVCRDIGGDDLLVVVTARKGTLSYHSYMMPFPRSYSKITPPIISYSCIPNKRGWNFWRPVCSQKTFLYLQSRSRSITLAGWAR